MAGGWVESFRRASDEDAEIQAHGKHYSCAFLLDMGEHSYLVKMHAGKVEEILKDLGPLDERYQFVIRASAETWRNFAQEPPPRMYHGIFAASFRGGHEPRRGPAGADAEPPLCDPADGALAGHRRADLGTEGGKECLISHRSRVAT